MHETFLTFLFLGVDKNNCVKNENLVISISIRILKLIKKNAYWYWF